MPNYVIHIGLPKTGTKYLQSHFRRHSEFLAARGMYYPAEWWTRSNEVNHDGLLEDLRKPRTDALEATFARLNASKWQTILLSCEGFSALQEPARDRLRGLIGGGSVRFVLFCRRWTDWIASAWQQSVKQGGLRCFPESTANVLADPRGVSSINFGHIVEGFASTFGRSSISLVSYSDVLELNRNLVEVFYKDVLGFEELPSIDQDTIHSSMGVVGAELVRTLNVLEVEAVGERAATGMTKRYERLRNHPSVRPMIEAAETAMQAEMGTMPIDETRAPFLQLYQELTERYRDLVIDIGAGRRFFQPQRAQLPFVRSDHLLRPGVADGLRQLYATIMALSDPAPAPVVSAPVASAPHVPAQAVPPAPVAAPDASAQRLHVAAGSATASRLSEIGARPDGVVIGFGKADQPAGALQDGWSPSEARFTWTLGKQATMRLPRPAQGGACLLSFLVRPFVSPPALTAQRVLVGINGHPMGEASVVSASVLDCSVPAEVVAAADMLTVTFDLPDAASPAALRGTADRRLLALCFERAGVFAAAAGAAQAA